MNNLDFGIGSTGKSFDDLPPSFNSRQHYNRLKFLTAKVKSHAIKNTYAGSSIYHSN